MADIVKFYAKDFNPDRLHDELIVAGIEPTGMRWSGFDHINTRLMEPFTETRVISTSTGQPDVTADPGELLFRYPSDPGSSLDTVLTAHLATNLSKDQQNEDSDISAIAPLVNNFQNWGSLSNAQKDNNQRQLTRLVARLLDSKQDI